MDASRTLGFGQLNQAFEAWLQSAYHSQVHRTTKQTPQDRYFTDQRIVRPVSITEVEAYFFKRFRRRVDLTYCDVSIDTRLYRVDPKLRGLQVEVQFNPFRTDAEQPDEVKLYSPQGVYLGIGQRYQRELGAHPPQQSAPPKPLLDSPYIKALLNDQEQAHEQARQGIDYHSAMRHGQFSLMQLIAVGRFSR